MPIAPSDATIEITGAIGVITGNMASRPIPIGLILYPGSNGGPGAGGREVTSFVVDGTTGATVTFKSAFPADFAAGTFFYVTDGPPIGTSGFWAGILQKMADRLEAMFGPDLVFTSETSRQITLARADEVNSFARIAYKVGNVLAFFQGTRTVGARKVWSLQTVVGGQIYDSIEVDQATGGVNFRSVETTVASAATVDLGAVRDRRIAITGTTAITSFGATARQEKIITFAASLSLQHSAGLILPGGITITTQANDTALAVSDAAGIWRVLSYQRANGRALTPTPAGEIGALPLAGGTMSGPIIMGGNVVRLNGAGDGNYLKGEANIDGVIVVASSNVGFATNGGTIRWLVKPEGLIPYADNSYSIGSGSNRATTVFATTGVIQTSDGRLKTSVQRLRDAEIAAASAMAAEIGTFQWLDAVTEKGSDGARLHVGLTVQRVIEIMRTHGLEPFRYAFICYDAWNAEPGRPAVAAKPGLFDEDGNEIEQAVPGSAAVPERCAGDRYSLRPDQLALFIARGQEARLAALEAALAA